MPAPKEGGAAALLDPPEECLPVSFGEAGHLNSSRGGTFPQRGAGTADRSRCDEQPRRSWRSSRLDRLERLARSVDFPLHERKAQSKRILRQSRQAWEGNSPAISTQIWRFWRSRGWRDKLPSPHRVPGCGVGARGRRRQLSLLVPDTRSTSCDLRVLVDQPTESIPPYDPPSRLGDSCRFAT